LFYGFLPGKSIRLHAFRDCPRAELKLLVKEYFVIIVQTIDFTVFAFSSSVLLEISAVVAFLLAK
jgi:hypothetical protein